MKNRTAEWYNRRSESITYTMKKGGSAEIIVIDVIGRPIRTPVRGFVQAGEHEVVRDGHDESDDRVAPGVYMYRLSADDAVQTRKLLLLR